MKAKVYSSNSANDYIEIDNGNFYSITPISVNGESDGPGGIIVRPHDLGGIVERPLVLVNLKRIKVKNSLKYKKYYKAIRKRKGNRIGYVKSNTDNYHAQATKKRKPKP